MPTTLVQTLLRLTTEPALVVGPADQVLHLNEAARELLGPLESGQVHLQSLVEAPAAELAEALRLWRRSLHYAPAALPLRCVDGLVEKWRVDGALLPAEFAGEMALFLRLKPQSLALRQFRLLDEQIRDLTREVYERRRVEAQRDLLLEAEQAARAEAQRANALKDEFLMTISHELRTPLSAIIGWAELLREGILAPEEQQEAIQTIERNSRQQARIISDILEISRVENGKLGLELQTIDLRDVLSEARTTAFAAAEAQNISLAWPILPDPCWIQADPVRLQQILWNLLTNSLKFTEPGGEIALTVQRTNGAVRVRVRDTGIGIAPELLPEIFQRFRQVDSSTTRRKGGLGLGLAIVRELVALHHGTIHAYSEGPGTGSMFEFTIPAAIQEGTGRIRTCEPIQAGDNPYAALAGLHILVVEDDPDNGALLKRILEDVAARVSLVDSVDAAVRVVANDWPDLVAGDLSLPGEDGFGLPARLRAVHPQGSLPPSIAVSALARPEDVARALEAGFRMHVAKPIQRKPVLDALVTLCL